MTIKALLIEDSQLMAAILEDLLKENHPEIEILGIAKNGKEGLEMIAMLNPDLVFLDIEMPDMTGFEMLNKLDTINFQTIFITAHSHYAIKAFRFNALDYLIKPIKEDELKQSIKRFKADSSSTENQKQLEQALVNLKTQHVEDQKLILQTHQGTLSLALRQIVKIEGERNYSYIHLSDKTKELSSKSLGYFEDILADKGFFRCHRSFLVNRLHIDSIQNHNKFLLLDNTSIPISRRKKSEAKKWCYD